ncbi:unnamed protein product [Jaminaea pallidilutea]
MPDTPSATELTSFNINGADDKPTPLTEKALSLGEHDVNHHLSPTRSHAPESAQPLVSYPPSKLERLMGTRLARHYGNPYTQIFIVGLVAFCCPGLFNALSGMGGGGQVNPRPADKANIALYSAFAVVSFFAGSIHNKVGTRRTMWLGTLGYTLYIGAFLSYNFNANGGFIIFAGTILGICASLFWTAQGAMMLAYPTEAQKGRFIAIFWCVFNMGGVIGSAVAMGLSWDTAEGSSLGNGVYAAFVVLTFLGGCLSATLKNPATVVRSDGSPVVVPHNASWKAEIIGLLRLLRTDPWVLLLFPMFYTSNFFYTYQQSVYQPHLFTLRTRALNSLLFWFAQIFGSLFLSLIVDNARMKRQTRAWIGWFLTLAIVFAVWGGTYVQQQKFSRDNLPTSKIDLTQSSDFVGPCLLYLFSGFMDAIWQCFTYWLMGAVSNDLSKCAAIVGFYKSLQSVGAATAFGLDLNGEPYMVILGVTWALCAAGLLCAVPVIAKRIHEHTDPLEEKTAYGREWEVKNVVETAASGTGTDRGADAMKDP